ALLGVIEAGVSKVSGPRRSLGRERIKAIESCLARGLIPSRLHRRLRARAGNLLFLLLDGTDRDDRRGPRSARRRRPRRIRVRLLFGSLVGPRVLVLGPARDV